MNMTDTLEENYCIDLRKRKADRFQRAEFIHNYIEKNRMNLKQFCEKFNIPQTTVQDWLLYNNITNEQYVEMKDKGISDSRIYDILRKRRDLKGKQVVKYAQAPDVVFLIDALQKVNNKLKMFTTLPINKKKKQVEKCLKDVQATLTKIGRNIE